MDDKAKAMACLGDKRGRYTDAMAIFMITAALAEARAEEQERCAKIAERYEDEEIYDGQHGQIIAGNIRAKVGDDRG